jgi:hypothetical protein
VSKIELQVAPGSMQMTDYFLDRFVAHKISLLSECGAVELPLETSWLSNFIRLSAFNVSLPAKKRAFAFNFLRRAEGTFSAYSVARKALSEYLSTPRNTVSPYFRAILNFEVCLSQCYQGFEILMTASGEKLFEKTDEGNFLKKLNDMYNYSKHMNERIDTDAIPPEATIGIWITNQGLESNLSSLTFKELGEILQTMRNIANTLISRLQVQPL